jgi:hypothetical protein
LTEDPPIVLYDLETKSDATSPLRRLQNFSIARNSQQAALKTPTRARQADVVHTTGDAEVNDPSAIDADSDH